MDSVATLVNQLSALQIDKEAVVAGIKVKRVAKQQWIVDGKPLGIKRGAKRLQTLAWPPYNHRL